MTVNKAFEGEFHQEKAIWLKSGKYEAAVLPAVGANLVAFRDTERQFHFLREPALEEMEHFKKIPYAHGIPVLFPPNRYEDGKLAWEGEVYQFPINEPDRSNHLHGFVHNIPWLVEQYGADDQEARVTLSLTISEGHPVYEYFPHSFILKLRYTLSEAGLLQHVMIRNEGAKRMPCLLGFHTTVNAPFAANSTAGDYQFKLTIGERWAMNERMLPTGWYQPLSQAEEKMQDGYISPFFEALDNHYTAVAQNGSNRMELLDTRNHVKLIYDVGTGFKQWMIWNNNASEGFFCPEPQINTVNATALSLPDEQLGLVALEPGELWEETSRMYVVGQ